MAGSHHTYAPLPTATSIRLVRLLRARSRDDAGKARGSLQCELVVTELEAAPPYHALSYTWKNAVQVSPRLYGDLMVSEHATYTVLCDGKPISVDSNLGYGLGVLASALDQPECQGLFSEYMWIDALSIDQTSNEERSSQVTQMGRIYRRAQKVIVWLGRGVAEEEELAGLVAINAIAHLTEFGKTRRVADLQTIRQAATYSISDESTYAALGLPRLGWKDWLGVYLWMSRRWFRRMWIIQEIVFAKDIIVLCGNMITGWDDLVKFAAFLSSSGWDAQLDRYITDHARFWGVAETQPPSTSDESSRQEITMSIVGSNSVWGSYAEKSAELYLIKTRQIPHVTAAVGVINSSQNTEAGLEVSDGHQRPTLLALCCKYDASETTDARDRVYSLLNLAPECQSPVHDHPPLLPDYTRSVRETYLATATFILAERRDLDLLLLSQSHYGTFQIVNPHNLPSWVPDFGYSPHIVSPLVPGNDSGMAGRRCPWHASAGLAWEGPYAPRADARLEVQGARIDRIAETVKLLDLVAIARILQEPLVGTNGPRLLTNSKYLEYLETLEKMGLVPQDFRHQPSFVTQKQSPFEIWWRTVLQDHTSYCFPAADGQGKRFYDEMQKLLQSLENNKPSDYEVEILAMDDPNGPVDTVSLRQAFENILQNSGFDPDKIPPVPNMLHSRAPYYMPRGMQLLFKSQKNYLGKCKRSVKVDDEVWILRGMESPVVLRPHTDGTYQLVDDVYVHGMMYGEAVEKEGVEFTKIFLR